MYKYIQSLCIVIINKKADIRPKSTIKSHRSAIIKSLDKNLLFRKHEKIILYRMLYYLIAFCSVALAHAQNLQYGSCPSMKHSRVDSNQVSFSM